MFGCHMNLEDINKKCWLVSSINENKIERILDRNPKQLTDLNKRAFVRVYPGGKRIDSSNYDPINGFLSGS